MLGSYHIPRGFVTFDGHDSAACRDFLLDPIVSLCGPLGLGVPPCVTMQGSLELILLHPSGFPAALSFRERLHVADSQWSFHSRSAG